MKRLRYYLRFIYWSVLHGTTKHAGWVLAYEGMTK